MVDTVAIGVRALSFVAALQAAGMPLFLWLFGDELKTSARPIAAATVRSSAIGLLAAVGYQLIEPARLSGGLGGTLDLSLQSALLASHVGTATALRVLGLLLVACGALVRTRAGAALGLVGGTVVVTSFAFMGHTATHEQRWLLAPLLLSHVGIVAFWFGALRPFQLVARYDDLATNGRVIERFSKAAVWLVPAILIAGLSLSIVLLPSLATLREPYGQLLLAKIGAFALLIALAALNKWRLGRRIRAQNAAALRTFRWIVSAEWMVIAAVLTATAALTGLFSPEH